MRFHYCWHYIFTDYPYLSLKDKGFEIELISDEMINGFKCNSVLFTKNNFIQELQFRELLDEEEFLNQQKIKGTNRGSIHNFLRPGVCFQHESLSEEFLLDGLEVSVGNSSAIPRKNRVSKNERSKVVGLLWNLSENDLEYFCRRLNLKVEDKKIKVSEDFFIFLADKNTELYQNFDSRKDFPFWAVVIQSENINIEDESSNEVQSILWMNQDAKLIKHHITHWDIILF
jgi:hypothetical protein